jgi:hypothetical protein
VGAFGMHRKGKLEKLTSKIYIFILIKKTKQNIITLSFQAIK